VCTIMLGFFALAFVGYVYAWVLAVRDIRARMRNSCARDVTVHVSHHRNADHSWSVR
jgi:hypothetical protein